MIYVIVTMNKTLLELHIETQQKYALNFNCIEKKNVYEKKLMIIRLYLNVVDT